MTQKGILLCGHGSKKQYNKELIENTANRISETHPQYIVKCGFMEFNEPTIPQALDGFRDEDISALAVVPLFLARGVHIDEDIPALLGFKQGQKTGTFKTNTGEIPLSYADPIGEHPVLADVMVASAEDAFKLIQ
ncbi:MAG: sirohydrochlorin nickelochelatase [Methanomicrobiales archaeon]|jgi:sirohydrochlorin cobaltochelatase|nr:sirohydrochlorin nickelochelatase [Methanomicrobiales archaeon]